MGRWIQMMVSVYNWSFYMQSDLQRHNAGETVTHESTKYNM
jgi:hypothetical protein